MKAIFFGLFAILALILAIDAASIPVKISIINLIWWIWWVAEIWLLKEVQPLAQPPSIDALKDAGVENIEELSASDEYVFELNQVPASEQGKA